MRVAFNLVNFCDTVELYIQIAVKYGSPLLKKTKKSLFLNFATISARVLRNINSFKVISITDAQACVPVKSLQQQK